MRSPVVALVAALSIVIAACSGSDATSSWQTGSGAPPAASGSPDASSGPSPSAAAGPTMTDPTLGVETAIAGLTEPTGMAFIGPDDAFVIEKSTGLVQHIADGQLAEPALDLAVNFFDERGLLGIALHPRFADNGYVYMYWTSSGEGEGADGLLGPDTDAEKALPELGNRVDRFVWDGSTLTFDAPIIALRSNTLETDTSGRIRGNHDAGPLVFGADGKLYVINGDQNLRGQLQNVPDGLAPKDADLTGVILRLNDDGTTPTDNPFAGAASPEAGEVGENIARIWAYGIRNSFGLAIHPTTGALWQTENGDDSWDEVNVFPAGSNSGWIQVIGPPERLDEYKAIEVASEDGLDNPDFPPDQLAGSDDEARSRLFEIAGSTYVPPVFAWKYPVAVTSIAFVTGDDLGASSSNTAWLGTVLTDGLYRYPLRADGSGFDFGDDAGLGDFVDDNTAKGDLGESADYMVGTGFGVVTHIVTGPDGLLYVVSLTGGAVYRIGPADRVGGGEGPAPSGSPTASGSPAAGSEPLTIGTDAGAALRFDPTEATVASGAQVSLTFENRSTVPHNLTFRDPIDKATSTTVAAGDSETLEFTAPDPGDYPFVCTLHPGMDGVLSVSAPG